MKKYLSYAAYALFAVSMTLSFSACGDDDDEGLANVDVNTGSGDKVVIQDAVYSKGNWICVDVNDIPYFLNSQKRTATMGWGEEIPEGVFDENAIDNYFTKYMEGRNIMYDDIVFGCFTDENHYNVIRGKVVIPSTIIYKGLSYSVICVGNEAIEYQPRITEVKIPNTVTRIEEDAFHDCLELKSINIPNSVVLIEKYAFFSENLKDIYAQRTNPEEYNCDIQAFAYEGDEHDPADYMVYEKCTLHVPTGYKSKYANTLPWSKFKKIVEN
ncbi:MAG: leucine-rich repeat protein [Alloprevotella sp.]|nr:leucine-rich repeat protein [Alloprevotella sp.]